MNRVNLTHEAVQALRPVQLVNELLIHQLRHKDAPDDLFERDQFLLVRERVLELLQQGLVATNPQKRIAELETALHKIVDRSDDEMRTALTLHYDMRGRWAKDALEGEK